MCLLYKKKATYQFLSYFTTILGNNLAPNSVSIVNIYREEPPALPKKIRSCCLYKYPDWVQGMVGGEGGGGGHGHSHGGGGGGLGSSQVRAKGSIPSISSRFRPEHHNHQWPSAAPQHARSAVSLRSTTDLSSKSVPNISESAGPSKAAGVGANSLLKQAIANRMMPHTIPESSSTNVPSSSATSPTTDPTGIHKTDSSEMTKSVLLNPAWYRDDQGRTGYKTSDWEKMGNQQKNVVKEKKHKRKESEAGVIKELDSDLLSQSCNEKADSEKDNKSLTSVQSDQRDPKDVKLEKKAAKALEKEKRKLEKEKNKLEKAQKKKEAEEEKKLKKKKGSSTNVSEVVEQESVEMKAVEKKKEKAEATIKLTMVSKSKKDKSYDPEKTKQQRIEEPKLHESTESDSSKDTMRKSSSSKESSKGVIKQSSQKSSKESSKEKIQKQSSKDEAPEKSSIVEGRPPPGTTHFSVRKLKAESTSKKSGQGEPRKKNIGDRRDSSMSELSRGSFKSVTFNDRVQTHEIERNSSVYTSSEDDAAIMSDDEMSKPSQAKLKKKLTLLQQQNPYGEMDSRNQQQEQTDIYDDDDLDDFEEQERLALLAAQGYDFRMDMQYREGGDYEDEESEEEEAEDNEDGEDTLSQNSYYAEDVEGADIYLRNEHTFLGTDVDRRTQGTPNLGVYDGFDRTMMGSMSKLHGEDSASNSLLFGYNLPRSASGYFEPPPEAGHMNFSYEEAILNRQVQAMQQQQLLQQLQKLPFQQSPQEIPGVHKLSPSGGSLRQTATQRSIYENVTQGDNSPSPQPQSLIIPQSPSQRSIQQARHEFFTQTPSNVVSKTIMAASSDGQSIKSLGSTDSSATIRVEDEMRKKFVARFGVRKAPIAREEDPADPQHVNVMGSQESMNSTDSRESVVSAASIKAEALARRNFNYYTSDPIGKTINERYNFNEMDRNLSALVKPLWAGTEKEERAAEKDESTSS
ncbi:hypothetical protein L3Y34_012023 [Caenorhabditis briggsae]|uniref:Uncharacterized protein n=1 Tax=Caenorhabditis briggsae TaxID=6238 RepID=A0AAE8ZSZ0_CAEBR|nr:hypothetical protein L3Y34_012023 [Caenorhabditis briggsae]